MSLQKKLERAYAQGFHDACNFWEAVADRTKGVGPVLKQRMMEEVRKMAEEIRRVRDEQSLR